MKTQPATGETYPKSDLFNKAGSSPAECDPMYKSFMSIRKKNKHGFLPDHTADARKKKLNECPAADAGTVSKIISSFGRLKNF
ncbi:TrbM/KikA/MpfK family conjugal transfer protein [Escherichia coli]|uniref:TrbM/KikA/MpfK family conjugal transfer protein n=1 Tax=Escherichia coli TaxID=562 RepID=UPI003A4E51E1